MRLLTWSFAQVRVEALGLEHDEQGSPAEQHGREEQVLDDRRHRHPPAAGEGRGQRGSHVGSGSLAWTEVMELRLEPGGQRGGGGDILHFIK